LCNHLWQSTLFLGIVALLALLRRKNQARIRYWLWMAASAKFLIPFSLLVSLGNHLPWPSHAAAPKTTAYVAIEEMSQPFLQVAALNTPIAIPVAQPNRRDVARHGAHARRPRSAHGAEDREGRWKRRRRTCRCWWSITWIIRRRIKERRRCSRARRSGATHRVISLPATSRKSLVQSSSADSTGKSAGVCRWIDDDRLHRGGS